MKKNLLKKLASMMGVAVMLVTIAACHKDPCKKVQMPEDTRSFEEQARTYLEYYQKEVENSCISKNQYAVYFDCSDGMEDAYKGGNREAVKQAVNGVFSKEPKMYGLQNGEIIPFQEQGWDAKTLFNRICDEDYTAWAAPIEDALKQIVREKRRTLLITDFEEYGPEKSTGRANVSGNNYAEKYFKTWVVDYHGVIKFFTLDFEEENSGKTLAKKLFFVVFDDQDQQFIEHMEKYLRTSHQPFKSFTLQASPCKASSTYPVGKGGNFLDSDGDDPLDFSYASFKDLNAEVYYNNDMLSWVQIAEKLMPYRKERNFPGLLSKLKVDLSNTEACYVKNLKLRVTDITEDFTAFTNHQFALTAVPVPDSNATLSCEQKFFYDADGNLSSEFEYNPVTPKDITGEQFLKMIQKRNGDIIDVAIDFGEEYTSDAMFDENGYLLNRDDLKNKVNGRILKVDICIAEREVGTDFDDLCEFFDFKSFEIKNNKKDPNEIKPNRCITNSVFGTLGALEKNNKPTVIYTYIIKDYPDGYAEIE